MSVTGHKGVTVAHRLSYTLPVLHSQLQWAVPESLLSLPPQQYIAKQSPVLFF